MLQMKCPECEGTISSPFLAEIGSITCRHCRETVTVKDVFVSTKSFTMHRETLLKRLRHYRTILTEVEKEKMLLGNGNIKAEASRSTLDQYYAALQELMAAARSNYRLAISQEVPAIVECAGSETKGRLVNLSTAGAAIKPERMPAFPAQGSELKVRLNLPDNAEPLSISAKIAWARKREKEEGPNSITMGIRFIDINENIRSCLWNYIFNTYNNSCALEH